MLDRASADPEVVEAHREVAADDPRIDLLLDQMLDHQDAEGRFPPSPGHGRTLKTVKWPPTWYGAYAVLDTLGRYPEFWRGSRIDPADRIALTELAACLVRYNVSGDGTVTPRSTSRGFGSSSFGRRKAASGLATARVLAVLHRLDDLAADAATVDVTTLGSSKGGSGTALPPAHPL